MYKIAYDLCRTNQLLPEDDKQWLSENILPKLDDSPPNNFDLGFCIEHIAKMANWLNGDNGLAFCKEFDLLKGLYQAQQPQKSVIDSLVYVQQSDTTTIEKQTAFIGTLLDKFIENNPLQAANHIQLFKDRFERRGYCQIIDTTAINALNDGKTVEM